MNEQIKSLFKDYYFLPSTKYPVLVGILPEKILEEAYSLVVACDQIKNHPLSFLKNHVNAGKNAFQVSIPIHLFENSFLMAFLIHLGATYVHRVNNIPYDELTRRIGVRKNNGHFDNYDAWINYAYEGSENPIHDHTGILSSVVYIKNTIFEPTVFEDGVEFLGKPGEVIIFPSEYRHGVQVKKTANERLTLAFNLEER